jgi:hypothetical protein
LRIKINKKEDFIQKIQYVIEGSFPKKLNKKGTSILQNNPQSSKIGTQFQKTKNTDILAGFADLPSGHVEENTVETYFKILSLFYEHILIPDGWFHCNGPLSNYLFNKYLKSGKDTRKPDFANNIVLEYLRNGIIIPGLRGIRPTQHINEIRGFDIFDVWNGDVRSENGEVLSLGVFKPEDERMAILDPSEENQIILKSLSENTQFFVDWTSPHIPVTSVCDNEKLDLEVWDNVFSEFVFSFLCDSESQITNKKELEILEKLGISFGNEVVEFWDTIGHKIIDLKRNNAAIRRGDIEGLVAEYLEISRLESYAQLYGKLHSPSEYNINFPLSNIIRTSEKYINPIAWLGSVILDRVTTIQEYLFSSKFNCKINNCSYLSQDTIDSGLFNKLNLNIDTPEFSPEIINFNEFPINFAGLTSNDILALRQRNKQFFWEMAEIKKSDNFWEDNKNLEKALTKYVKDIYSVSPLKDSEKLAIDLGAGVTSSCVTGAIVGFATTWAAGLSIAGFGPLVIYATGKATKVVPPLSRFLAKKISPKIYEFYKKIREKGRVDCTLRLIKEDGLTRTDSELK